MNVRARRGPEPQLTQPDEQAVLMGNDRAGKAHKAMAKSPSPRRHKGGRHASPFLTGSKPTKASKVNKTVAKHHPDAHHRSLVHESGAQAGRGGRSPVNRQGFRPFQPVDDPSMSRSPERVQARPATAHHKKQPDLSSLRVDSYELNGAKYGNQGNAGNYGGSTAAPTYQSSFNDNMYK